MCPQLSVLGACLAVALAFPVAAQADTFPAKPITIVVPFPPGGPTDSSARLLAKAMGDSLHQPVIIDNRAGAGGTIGSAYVARAQPDGYTLLWGGTSSLAVAPALYASLPYQPLKSFVPIGQAVRSPMMVVGKSSLAATDMTQLIQAAKSSSLTFGSAGNGSIGHLTGEQLNTTLGIKLLHVPYKGGAPALTDVLGGQIDLMIDTAQFPVASRPVRQGPRVRSGWRQTFSFAAQCAHRPGSHGKAVRGLFMVWPGSAGRHAGVDRQSPGNGAERCHARPRHAQATHQQWTRACK